MILNQKGEGKGGAIFGFAVFALVLYLGFTIIPVMIKVYAFEDAVREECKFMNRRGLEQLKADLVAVAEEKDVPVAAEDISMSAVQVENHRNLRVDITYVIPIKTPFYVYNWKQVIAYDAPVFD